MFALVVSFVQFLRVRQGQNIYLKPYWGNSGDELIWMGCEIVLQEVGLNRVLDPRAADIILRPGGNPTMWQGPFDEFRDSWRLFPSKEFVIAPATFQGDHFNWRTILKNTDTNIAGLFARDRVSYQNLQELGLKSKIVIGLGHDPAFHLQGSEWLEKHKAASTSEYVLASFRGDHESAFRPQSLNKWQEAWPISSVFVRYYHKRKAEYHRKQMEKVKAISGTKSFILERDASLMSFQIFVECIRRATKVHTDRLHCMVLALLLDKEVFVYPTAYSKLEGVYNQSAKSWAKVHFVEV